ncbi:MAG TPA: lyase family protein, partial [Microthrixaceae bacterium]|nr:lyase family protein [Microthrixaceae bacterium]
IDVFQTGSGTSTNMNVNEVLAHRAAEISGLEVHPNDHVNASQSSNDVIPSAIRIAVALELRDALAPALDDLILVIRSKAAAHDDVVKSGRTHLMDAAPLFVGQEMGAWAAQVSMSRVQVGMVLDVLGALPLGGSAVGTGLNVARGWADAVIADLARSTGLPLRPAPDRFAAMAGGEAYAAASALTRGVAVTLTKVANDLRLLASGPRTGFAEMTLPALQPGSSIMPGKVNPVIPEAALQVAARVMGNDTTVMVASSQGTLQLNTYLPVIADSLLESITLLTSVTHALGNQCIAGIEVDAETCRRYALASPALVTGLATTIGYDRAAAAVHRAQHEDRDLRVVLLEDGVDASILDWVLQPERLARGGPVDGRGSGA